MNYEIWTDGAYSSAKNQGGIGFVILKDSKEIFSYSKTYKNTTNNRMEILAAIVALESIKIPSSITVISDSQYLVKTLIENWKKNKNLDLWDRINKIVKFHKSVTFKWCRGHDNNEFNNKCDKLAVKASQV